MTAILFIPATGDLSSEGDGRSMRRIDFASLAGLFAEAEEPPRHRRRSFMRTAAVVLLALVALGDTLLVARPDAFAACFLGGHPRISARLAPLL